MQPEPSFILPDKLSPKGRSATRPSSLRQRTTALNTRFRHHSATAVLRAALSENIVGNLALVSSFGAESVALLHLASMIDCDIPVIFIDTEMLFTETLVYQQEVAERLGLRNLTIIRADAAQTNRADPKGMLHKTAPDACCALRKSAPLERSLARYDGWITGRKRYQGGARAALEFFEVDAQDRVKLNPLAHWGPVDTAAYMDENRLPRHPLVARGYPSIGCVPCTSSVTQGADPRAGRWQGHDKSECGIHFVDGRVVPGPMAAATGGET